jgi:hypothetical protein
MPLSDGLGILGLVVTVLLVILDKTDKVKGPVVFGLLTLAAILTVPLALSIAGVGDMPSGMAKLARGALVISLVGVVYSGLAIWIAQPAAPSPMVGFHEGLPETVHFSLGERGITMGVPVASLTRGQPTLMRLNGMVPVTLSLENGIIYCDVEIWGGPGGPPIQVRHNEFVVQPPEWDRNFSERAVEVVDAQGVPIFQLIRKTVSHYVVNGILPFPGGGLIVATDQGTALNPSPGNLARARAALKPIFKYPSWKYHGQFVEP